MAVGKGLEPLRTESKSVVLPLHYPTIRGGFTASRKVFSTDFAALGATIAHDVVVRYFCLI